MASIVTKRLSNGKPAYLVRYRTPDGAQRNKQFARRRDADRYANLVELDLAQGSWVDPRLGRITLAEWFERWWPTVTTLRPTTRARDEASFRNHVLPTFGDVPIGKLERTRLREWVTGLTDPDGAALAPATAVKAVQVFNKVMRAAVDDRLIHHNPVAKLPVPRITAEEMRFLTVAELWALADAIDRRYRGLVLLGGYGGLRIGEMLALRWGRVDVDGGAVSVIEAMTELAGHISFGPPKTRAGVRRVTVPGFVVDALRELEPNVPADDELVFRSPEDHAVRLSLFRRRFWNPAVTGAGIAPLRIHDLRHTAVALWIAAGANPKQIADRAGHTSVSVVLDRYGHLLPQHDDALMTALEAGVPVSAGGEP